MIIRTVGELRAALACYPDERPLYVGAFGCRNSVKEVVAWDGDTLIIPIGLGDLFDADHAAASGGGMCTNPP